MGLGQNIKARRKALKLTLEDVAAEVGTSKQTIQRYESGQIANIPQEKIERLAAALGTTPAALVGWEASPDAEGKLFPIRVRRVPMLGKIACGTPIYAEEEYGTYLAVVSPDHNVLPIITGHFQDRFNDQSWLIYDAKRHYGYYYDGQAVIRVTFEDEASVPFDLTNGKMNADVLSENDKLFQDLWRTYFKAICIKERMNPRKQLSDMPRRYWKYMTEKNGTER